MRSSLFLTAVIAVTGAAGLSEAATMPDQIVRQQVDLRDYDLSNQNDLAAAKLKIKGVATRLCGGDPRLAWSETERVERQRCAETALEDAYAKLERGREVAVRNRTERVLVMGERGSYEKR